MPADADVPDLESVLLRLVWPDSNSRDRKPVDCGCAEILSDVRGSYMVLDQVSEPKDPNLVADYIDGDRSCEYRIAARCVYKVEETACLRVSSRTSRAPCNDVLHANVQRRVFHRDRASAPIGLGVAVKKAEGRATHNELVGSYPKGSRQRSGSLLGTLGCAQWTHNTHLFPCVIHGDPKRRRLIWDISASRFSGASVASVPSASNQSNCRQATRGASRGSNRCGPEQCDPARALLERKPNDIHPDQ